MQKPKAESPTKSKNTPVAKVAPSPKPTAFVIPSIMVDPGTPKATLKATVASKPKESIVMPTESVPEKEPVSAPASIPTISTPEPEVAPDPTPQVTPKITEVSVSAPSPVPTISTPEPEITPAPTPEPAPKSTALTPGPAHKPSTAFTPFSAPIIAPAPPVIVETPEPEEIIEIPVDSTDGGQLPIEGESSSSLGVAPNESRRFSQLPPASAESPNAVKLGNFAVIPTPNKETKETSEPATLGSTLNATQESEKSRRFSQLPPASVDSPNAVKVGKFGVVPTPEKSQSPKLSPVGRLLLAEAQAEKSRRFSKLPPASVDSPNAVKLGSKFTMISREQAEK